MPMGLGKAASQMTLAELKAQAARVFAEECVRYSIDLHPDGPGVLLDLGNACRMEFRGDKAQCEQFITMRGLEARDRWLAENWLSLPDMLNPNDPSKAIHDVFAALGRQEG
jgi:hypothetical protein